MVPLRPLPVAQQPIAGANAANQVYWQYWDVLDQVIRALLAAGINKQTGTAYSFALSDVASIVEMSNGAANTVTIQPDNIVSFPIGTRIRIVQVGTGTTTIAAGPGVTIRNRLGVTLAAQWAVAEIYKRAANDWLAWGDLV